MKATATGRAIAAAVLSIACAVLPAGPGIAGNDDTPDPVITRTHEGHEQVFVRSGLFWMGLTESSGQTNEQPQHRVWISDLWIDRTEVTNGQYRACVDAGKCRPPERWHKSDLHPVVYVDWEMADTYCRWKGMRLPTEAEWEKAASWCPSCLDPEHKRDYPWGEHHPNCARAVLDDEEFGCGHQSSWPVGSKPVGASAYGALDMGGNVWEWTADLYDARAYVGRDNVSNPTGPEKGDTRVMRGGSWATKPPYLRAAGRLKYLPPPTFQDVGVGFRCAVSGGENGDGDTP